MEIVDGQLHAWRGAATDSLVSPHIDGVFDEERVLPLMDAAGVSRAVLVTPVWSDDGNATQLDMARKYPERFGVMGYLPVDDPESRGQVTDWLAQPGMLGIRFSFSRRRHAALLKDGSVDWIWDEAEAGRVPVMVYAPLDISNIAKAAQRHPDLRIIVDHMAVPLTVRGADLEPYIDELVKLESYRNVAVKVSSLPHFSATAYPHADVHPHVARVIDTFGPARSFWGTDITWGAAGKDLGELYREAVSMMDAALAPFDASERESVMGRGILDWLDWH
jgi:L-fuconolactonase